MIVYEPNRHFWGDIGHLARSWTMIKILRGVLLIGIYALLICLPLEWWALSGQIKLSGNIFSFLGIVLSILLVFRTNSAYDRWWEGRKQWGALVNHARNLAINVHAAFPSGDDDARHQMAVLISNFCIAFKEHLRKGVLLEEFIHVSPHDLELYRETSHVPNFIVFQMYHKVQETFRDGGITEADHINLKHNLNAFLDILGACERIKKTPIPFSYAVYIRLFILAYAALLPFVLVPTLGLWTVPLVMFIFFAFLGVELMAEEIEDPFGLDCNDLPTGNIAHTIKNNVFEILESKHPIASTTPELYQKVF